MGKLELRRDSCQFSKNICWVLCRIFDTQAKTYIVPMHLLLDKNVDRVRSIRHIEQHVNPEANKRTPRLELLRSEKKKL